LNEVTFGEIVREDWRIDLGDGVISAQRRLVMKLHKLKNRLKIWIVNKKKIEERAHLVLEEQITCLTKKSWETILTSEEGGHLKLLELERNKLMLEEEAHWRLKSIATWIQCGDRNTK
jgi:hypothetical protein